MTLYADVYLVFYVITILCIYVKIKNIFVLYYKIRVLPFSILYLQVDNKKKTNWKYSSHVYCDAIPVLLRFTFWWIKNFLNWNQPYDCMLKN